MFERKVLTNFECIEQRLIHRIKFKTFQLYQHIGHLTPKIIKRDKPLCKKLLSMLPYHLSLRR